jgi:hypothetical protein
MLIGRAQNQFADLIDNHLAYEALMERIIRLVDEPVTYRYRKRIR